MLTQPVLAEAAGTREDTPLARGENKSAATSYILWEENSGHSAKRVPSLMTRGCACTEQCATDKVKYNNSL